MKQFWHEFCIYAYVNRFQFWAMLLVIAVWVVLAELVIPRNWLDAIVYCSFGWFVLGKIAIPWTEQKLQKLFN